MEMEINQKEESVSVYAKLDAEVMRLERWQYVAFSAAAAERGALIVHSFASPESAALFDQGLELVWRSVTQEGLAGQAEQLINRIEEIPETMDDVPGATYYAKAPIYVLEYGLEAVVKDDPEPVTRVVATTLYSRDELDVVADEAAGDLKQYPPGKWPPPGKFNLSEVKHLWQSLELIKSVQKPDAALISSLRRLAQEANKGLESVITEIHKVEG